MTNDAFIAIRDAVDPNGHLAAFGFRRALDIDETLFEEVAGFSGAVGVSIRHPSNRHAL